MSKRRNLAVLSVLRAFGVFRLARRLTRGRLRILCYHGFSIADEHDFRPALFVKPATMDARLAHLRDAGYTVLPLGEAVERLYAGTLPRDAVVVTIDDGFYSTLTAGQPLFREYGTPVTLYVTTYYVRHQHPIYNLTLSYILWRTRSAELDFRGLGVPELDETVRWSSLGDTARQQVVDQLVRHGNMRLSRDERLTLLRGLAVRAGVDFDRIERLRVFGLVTPDELQQLRDDGMSIELHTHRHWSPGDEALAHRELADNRAEIERLLGRTPRHFCYPSGRDDCWQDAWLADEGIDSATTCLSGFCTADTPRFHLNRFLDGEHVHQLEFEAELSGTFEVARRLAARLGRVHAVSHPFNPAECRPELAGRAPTPVAASR